MRITKWKKKKLKGEDWKNITFKYNLNPDSLLTGKLSCINTIQINISQVKNFTKEHCLTATSNMAIFDDNQ